MAESPRKQVIAAIADYLKTPVDDVFPTSASRRVFDGDSTPSDADSVPEINVLFIREEIDGGTDHQPGAGFNNPVRRVMEVNVEVYDDSSDSLDVAWEVEEALRANPTLSDTIERIRVQDVNLYVAENQTVALYVSVIKLEVTYWTHVVEEEGRPTTILLGFSPDIGPGNEDKYTDITAAELPGVVL